jgi:hypothetical protein
MSASPADMNEVGELLMKKKHRLIPYPDISGF